MEHLHKTGGEFAQNKSFIKKLAYLSFNPVTFSTFKGRCFKWQFAFCTRLTSTNTVNYKYEFNWVWGGVSILFLRPLPRWAFAATATDDHAVTHKVTCEHLRPRNNKSHTAQT
jgi:hypothetical protein